MATLVNTDVTSSELVVHLIPSKDVYKQLKESGLLTDQSLYKVQGEQELRVYKDETNQMAANGRILMDENYTPSSDNDIATKAYVDAAAPNVSITPTVGTQIINQIYIGSTAPSSGTTPLIWIDTTASTGVLKYRTSTTGAWMPVPVAWG